MTTMMRLTSDGSSASTTTTTTTTTASAADGSNTVTTVKLRSEPRKLVHFSEDVVDNEHLNRKKSKGRSRVFRRDRWLLQARAQRPLVAVCCIFKKARGFDESSSDESDGAHSGDEAERHNNAYDRDPAKRNRRRRHKHAHGALARSDRFLCFALLF